MTSIEPASLGAAPPRSRDARSDAAPSGPIGLLASLLWFGIPAAIFSASLLGLLPWMLRQGISPFVTFNVTFGVPLLAMLVAALVVARREGNVGWPALRRRLRLEPMGAAGWAWTLALCAFTLLPIGPPEWMQPWLAGVRLYTPPQEFVAFRQAMVGGDTFIGIRLAGQWWILGWYMVALLVLNIGGEELWWRGAILPRQELALGRWAWVANGALWAAFHIFYHDTLLSFAGMLPGTLALAFVCQRTRSTWPGIIGHTVMNGAIPVMLVRGILA